MSDLAYRGMTGLGGLNPSPEALVVALVQSQVPTITEPQHLKEVAHGIADLVGRAKAGMPSLDIVVVPEYSLNGLNPQSWAKDELLTSLDDEQIDTLRAACAEHGVWGCFSLMERNPSGAPFNSGIIVDDAGEIVLYYRKMHPWVPFEPWEPGDLGIPVVDGPKGSRLALIICHDGMLPEMAREAAYKGANVILRTAGYTYPIKTAWRATNQVNAFTNLAFTASVALAGMDETSGISSMGEAMFCDFAGEVIEQGDGTPNRIVTAAIEPRRADEARLAWGAENNIYQLGHRGYTAVRGGARDCPYTFMQDLVAGTYTLPWEDDVQIKDGTSVGFGPPREPGSTVDTALRVAPKGPAGG